MNSWIVCTFVVCRPSVTLTPAWCRGVVKQEFKQGRLHQASDMRLILTGDLRQGVVPHVPLGDDGSAGVPALPVGLTPGDAAQGEAAVGGGGEPGDHPAPHHAGDLLLPGGDLAGGAEGLWQGLGDGPLELLPCKHEDLRTTWGDCLFWQLVVCILAVRAGLALLLGSCVTSLNNGA